MSGFTHRSSELAPLIFGGVILIALAGFGMNTLSQRSSRTSEGHRDRLDLNVAVLDQERRIRRYQAELEREAEKQVAVDARKEELALHEKLLFALEAEKIALADLDLAVTEEEAALRKLEEQQVAYRKQFRSGHWPKFVDMDLTQEHFVRKIPFQDAKVVEIDAAGLMVRHRSGVARVEVEQLVLEFRNRLDLSVEEARKVMTEMLIQDAQTKQARVRRANRIYAPSQAEIEAIIHQRSLIGRAKVLKYFRLVQRAEKTAQIARYNDQYSSSRSAPGKLETWRERAQRFAKAQVRYEELLAEAMAEVRRYEPDFQAPTE